MSGTNDTTAPRPATPPQNARLIAKGDAKFYVRQDVRDVYETMDKAIDAARKATIGTAKK